MTLGERILHYRKCAGLSQEMLAERLGVSRQAVSKWELDDALPDTDKLVPLARALGVSVDELLGNAAAPPAGGGAPPGLNNGKSGPSWLATHWYWLGLIPVVWGVWMLIRLLVMLLFVAA